MSLRYMLFGLPCGQCGHAAHHIEVLPIGVRTVHVDRWKRPCGAVQAARKSRPGAVPRAPVLNGAIALVRLPSVAHHRSSTGQRRRGA